MAAFSMTSVYYIALHVDADGQHFVMQIARRQTSIRRRGWLPLRRIAAIMDAHTGCLLWFK